MLRLSQRSMMVERKHSQHSQTVQKSIRSFALIRVDHRKRYLTSRMLVSIPGSLRYVSSSDTTYNPVIPQWHASVYQKRGTEASGIDKRKQSGKGLDLIDLRLIWRGMESLISVGILEEFWINWFVVRGRIRSSHNWRQTKNEDLRPLWPPNILGGQI